MKFNKKRNLNFLKMILPKSIYESMVVKYFIWKLKILIKHKLIQHIKEYKKSLNPKLNVSSDTEE